MPLVIRPKNDEWVTIHGVVFVKIHKDEYGRDLLIIDAPPHLRVHRESRSGKDFEWPSSADALRTPAHLR
ncbi:MAG: hypothetical protein D6746_08550 [Bacteroidetes bacterium]|nr:MAG: hypothetical protein D6746_08550 [Bacteroidota bacterium]